MRGGGARRGGACGEGWFFPTKAILYGVRERDESDLMLLFKCVWGQSVALHGVAFGRVSFDDGV